jgi:4-nitrophenyl phosphatase
MSKNPPTPGRGSVATDARLARARHLLVDLDGTLVRQQEPIAGAAELLAHFDGRYAIVSNNSTHTAPGLALRLRRIGLRVPAERIVLAGELAVRQLAREHPGARVLMAASPALQRLARSLGCEQVQAGAQGRVVPETGALLAAVTTASGVQPWRVVGKPAPLLFEEGLRCLGARAEDTVVVGDNPLTDAEGAARLGMACVLVGSASGAAAPSVAGLLAPAPLVQAEEAVPQYRLSDSTSKVWRSVRTEVS